MSAELIEALLDLLTSVYILEFCPLLPILFILPNLGHFIAEEDIDLPLLAFIKSNLICVIVLEDSLVGSPVLNPGVVSRSPLEFLLSKKVIVVESVERETFILEWICWVVDNEVSVIVMPSMPVVPVHS